VVADDFNGKGLGSRLMECIMDVAREKGLAEIDGLVLANNQPMLKLMRSLGFHIKAFPRTPSSSSSPTPCEPRRARPGRCHTPHTRRP
jgi:GNAT superfamily N-acetyltransferase